MDLLQNEMIGQVIDDRYRVDKFLAEGGFGAVFKGSHIKFGKKIRDIAIKIIKTEIPEGEEKKIFAEAFIQLKAEADITETITREKLIKVYDFGVILPERRGYIVMEFISCTNLQKEISDFNGIVPENISLKYIEGICQGLAFLHQMTPPLIHRDLKPDNILITDKKSIKIADWGLAARLNETFNWVEGVCGVPLYMAPETLTDKGISFTESDVYSLGIIWYEMLTGKTPFEDRYPPNGEEGLAAANWRRERRRTMRPVPPVKLNNTCSERISNIVMRCLEYNYSQRYKDAGALLSAIRSKDLSREDCLAAAEDALSREDYRQAAEYAERGGKLMPDKIDRVNFSLEKVLAYAWAHIDGKENDAAKRFSKIRNDNEKLKWLTAKKDLRDLLQTELALHQRTGSEVREKMIKQKLKRLEKS